MKYTYTANTLRTLNAAYSKAITSDSDKNAISNKDIFSYFIEDDFAVKGTMHSIENILKLTLKMEKKIILIFPTRNDLIRIENGENYKKLLWYKIMVNLTNKYSAKLIDLADHVSVKDHEKMTFECDDHRNSYGHSYVTNLIFENIYK